MADISTATKIPGKYFQMKGVKVHYLTEGDQFMFRYKTVKTNKAPLTPSQNGFSDSADILSAYECTRLITRLVDQKGVFNEGRTKTPEDKDYPSTTPPFSLSFYRGGETKGYRSGSRVSAEGVLLDISAETRQ